MSLQQELELPRPIAQLDHESVMSLVMTGQLMAKEGDRLLRAFGLTDSQFNILLLLRYQADPAGVSQTRLGRMLLVNRSNVTGLVDRMEQAGWVERGALGGDRRVKTVRLTATGRRLTDRAEKIYFGRIALVMGALSRQEQQQLCKFLERVRERLRR
jgi:DNA-binding MarR family transcriptional regulator